MVRALCYWSSLGYLFYQRSGPFAFFWRLVQIFLMSFQLTRLSALVWLLVQVVSMSFLLMVSDSAVATHLVWTGLVLFLVCLDLLDIAVQGLEHEVLFL
jgi:hypothetical protein